MMWASAKPGRNSAARRKHAIAAALSFVVGCESQKEIDEVWSHLSAVPAAEQCAWLQDKYGVSWQVVPAALGQMMGDAKSGNPAKMMEALLKMRKLDIATLERAYRGGA